MKAVKKFVIVFFIFSFMLIIIPISVSAHTSNLGIDGDNDITFDDCDADNYVSSSDIGDGYNEKWYDLMWGKTDTSTTPDTFNYTVMYHIDDDINTVYYQFQDNGYDQSTTTWSTGVGEKIGNDVKTKFENSMLKWNSVFYYKLNSEGFYEKHRIINLVNFDSLEDKSGITPHILIYPYYSTGDFSAETSFNYSSEIKSDTKTSNGIKHKHFTQFRMQVNTYFLSTSTALQNRTGAHELGHVLGLFDIDTTENPNQSSLFHHEEILMGYSKNNYSYSRQTEITYKDIAGVSITRGFHTNSDHLWLYDEDNPKDGKYKLICSLCNCVKYVDDLSSYNYYEYEQCGHSESSLPNTVDDNMIPVASYGNTDYYKCKYCRYVAPSTSRITQNYVYCGEHNDSKHILENIGGNLNYKITENHSMTINLIGNHYKCSGCDFSTLDTLEKFSLSNYSSTINKTINLSGNETKYYKINSNYNKYYEFIVDGTYDIDLKLFDENFTEILVDDLNDSNSIEHIINQLQVGTYYLEIKNSSSSANSTSIKIVSRTTAYISVGDNDVLLNTYNNISEYVYTNNRGPGIYRIKLNGAIIDETFITYPLNSLTLYTDSTRSIEVEKLYFDEDEILVYLPSNGAYYLNINLNEASYSSLSINISSIEKNTIDYINGLTSIRFNIIFENKNSLYYYEEVTIKQKSEIQLDIMTSGTITDSIPVYVYSRIFNEETNKYDLVETFIGEITPIDRVPVYTLVLDAGTYYFGYKNNIDNTNINFGIRRMVDYNMNMEGILVADPDETGFELGTEVLINKGECNKYYITEGFTRNIYLLAEDKFSIPISRLDYDWYSSNEAVATVTNYGTVLAMPVTIDTEVTIYAVLKADPKIVYYRTFTVLNDEEENLEEIILNMSYSYVAENGTYQLELTNINCPYPMIQYYSWNIINNSEETVTMNYWGQISSTGTCTVLIEGTYNLNSRVRLYITLTIE